MEIALNLGTVNIELLLIFSHVLYWAKFYPQTTLLPQISHSPTTSDQVRCKNFNLLHAETETLCS